MKKPVVPQKEYQKLIRNIANVLAVSRQRAAKAVNAELLKAYWRIGKYVVEYEQDGSRRAQYGEKMLRSLARDLTRECGKGFSYSNLKNMRLLYVRYPKSQTLSGQLGWSHYVDLLSISDALERGFYEKQCIAEKWSVRELKRQKDSALFHRVAISKSPKEVLCLAKQGQKVDRDKDIIRDPYILEFLKVPEDHSLTEKSLEQKIIDNLQSFLLEMGKGFAFVASQYRITLGNNHYYVDLVFYHRILKCFVLIDLKITSVKHQDIGQMNMYLNYFKREENVEGDNAPIGIILSADKDDVLVEYATGGISNKLFVSKYRLHLPNKKVLTEKLRRTLELSDI